MRPTPPTERETLESWLRAGKEPPKTKHDDTRLYGLYDARRVVAGHRAALAEIEKEVEALIAANAATWTTALQPRADAARKELTRAQRALDAAAAEIDTITRFTVWLDSPHAKPRLPAPPPR